MRYQKTTQSAFTLIELLIVISIIGLLASIVLVSLNSARGKARDAKRLGDKRQIVTAMNLYYNDNNAWPPGNGTYTCFGAPATESCWNGSFSGNNALVTAMTTYMSAMPTTGANSGTYAYNRYLYNPVMPGSNVYAGSPAGAWIVWPQENAPSTTTCPANSLYHYDAYYYCFEFLGP